MVSVVARQERCYKFQQRPWAAVFSHTAEKPLDYLDACCGSQVEVTNSTTGERTVFPYYNWVDKKHGLSQELLPDRDGDGKADAAAAAAALVPYDITVRHFGCSCSLRHSARSMERLRLCPSHQCEALWLFLLATHTPT